MIFEARETINCSVDVVWRYLTEPGLMAGWMPGIESMRTSDGGPLSKETQLFFTARGSERTSSVVAYERDRLIALQSKQGPFTATYTYAVQPAGAGGAVTEVTLQADCIASGMAKIIAPLIRSMIRKADQGQLRDLKTAVEQAVGTGTA